MPIPADVTELIASLGSRYARALTKSEQVEVSHLLGIAVDHDPTLDLHRAAAFLLEVEFGIHDNGDENMISGGDRAAGQGGTSVQDDSRTENPSSQTPTSVFRTSDGQEQIKHTKRGKLGDEKQEKMEEKHGNWTPEELDRIDKASVMRQYAQAFRTLWKY